MAGDVVVLDGIVSRPGPGTCDPELPSVKCDARKRAEALGTMRFHPQARGWEYPVPVVRRRGVAVETWEVCPFCLMALPSDEVPRLAKGLPYVPPPQPDNPR